MEPLRAGVDFVAWSNRHQAGDALTPILKKTMLSLLSAEIVFDGQKLPLWVALQRYTAAFKDALAHQQTTLEIPKWTFSADIDRCG